MDEGTLQAFLDGELAEGRRVRVERHLTGCEPCSAELHRLRSASAELAAALAALDRPAPRAEGHVIATPRRPSPWGLGAALPRAAVFILGFAAAASATIPGSPVRRWVESALGPRPEATTTAAPVVLPPAAVSEPAPAVAEAAPEAGVSIRPEGGETRVQLRDAAPGLRVRAVLTDGGRVGVFATGDAAGASFRTAPGRIEVVGAGAGELRIELPRSVAGATVEVDGVPYLVKEGDRLRPLVPVEGEGGAGVVFRVRG